ncbi:MAG: HAMP domain-containing histidine kinase [Lachnospiraceae bacterium]|nr:HAMP domain-containing histidine kinase [Lachnospiraceae bacterium]
MKKQERIILTAYLKEHIREAVIYGAIVVILLGLAGLYEYEKAIENMSYAAVLIAFFGAVYGVWDYFCYRKKCRLLIDAFAKRGERLDYLPESRSYPEKLYRELVGAAEEEARDVISEYDAKKRDIDDYYTMWTHQIKTPIAALRLLLQDEKQPLEELFKIEQYAEMALHYARLDSLSSDFLFKTQNIEAIVKQAVKKYSILFIGSGLQFSLENFSAQAVTDEKWLAFVVEQLLSNAIKYTPDGQIRIYGLDDGKTEIQEHDAHKEAAYLVIEDSGIGIREEDLPRIFERGFTGYNGRFDGKSTGIGLYLCKQILDRLSHTIQVESRVGKGTKVILGFARTDHVT